MLKHDKERYDRQILLSSVGEKGQNNIINSHVMVVGCGGLGSTVLRNIIGAGVGKVSIFDDDVVELSNLPRQSIFSEDDLNLSKVLQTKNKLQRVNRRVEIKSFGFRFSQENLSKFKDELVACDILVDCSDNLDSKYFINELSAKFDKTLVYGSIAGYSASSSLVKHTLTGCLNCVFPQETEQQAFSAKILGTWTPAVTLIASIQSSLVLEFLLNKHDISLVRSLGSFITVDLDNYSMNKMKLTKICKLHF